MTRLVLTGILLLQGVLVTGQIAGTVDVLRQSFSDLRHREFQEKVYLHTDKSYYVVGEYVWFSIYRTDAATHLPGIYSRFIYVELYDGREQLITRLKVMERDGFFHGSLPLDRYLPEGRYTLRAYTYWMQNFDEAFYFNKEIAIGHAMTYGVRPEIRRGKTEEGQEYAEVRIRDAEGNIFPGEFLDCRMYHNKDEVRKDVERINAKGWVRYPLQQKDSVTSVRVQFLDKKPFEYQAVFKLPALEDTKAADVQFFPEGGALIAGLTSRVGVKAVGADGYGIDVYGSVYRDDDELVGGFVSSHRGMGRFALQPEAGRRYYALVHLPWGDEKRVDLPAVQADGITLRADVQDSVIRYVCQASPDFQADNDLFLLVHSRGVLLSALSVEPGWSGSLPLVDLPAGIIHGVIADRQGHTYSQRLSFVYPEEKTTVAIQPDRSAYGYRDSVFLQLALSGADTLLCSVAVTDSLLAPPTRWSMDIVNYFLLTSDLKGHVEDPGWYFDHTLPRLHRERMLDLLLATQGWTRFDVGRVCRNERDSLPFFLELTQGFSGYVRNLRNKVAKNSSVFVVAPSIHVLQKVETDQQGRFSLNILYPDSTTFVLQALSARNTKWVELYMNKDSLRRPLTSLLRSERIIRPDSTMAPDLPALASPERVKVLGHYYEHNRKIYMLEEAKVVRNRKRKTYLEDFEHIAEQILEARDIREENIASLEEWFLSIPGVNIVRGASEDTLFYGYAPSAKRIVCIYVNDIDLCPLLPPHEILEVLRGVEIQYVERMGYVDHLVSYSGQPLKIYIYLTPGYSLFQRTKRLDFIQFAPLGYHEPAEFYQPRYEVEEERRNPEPDERPTLYWNPTVRLTPGQPQLLKFYTSDREGPFRVVLEGVTEKGEVVRVTKSLRSCHPEYREGSQATECRARDPESSPGMTKEDNDKGNKLGKAEKQSKLPVPRSTRAPKEWHSSPPAHRGLRHIHLKLHAA